MVNTHEIAQHIAYEAGRYFAHAGKDKSEAEPIIEALARQGEDSVVLNEWMTLGYEDATLAQKGV